MRLFGGGIECYLFDGVSVTSEEYYLGTRALFTNSMRMGNCDLGCSKSDNSLRKNNRKSLLLFEIKCEFGITKNIWIRSFQLRFKDCGWWKIRA